MKPAKDPGADELRNKNLNQAEPKAGEVKAIESNKEEKQDEQV